MNWGSWSNFWAMGGYALYVWGSYVVTLLFIVTEIVLLLRRKNSVMRFLARMARNNYGRTKDETEA